MKTLFKAFVMLVVSKTYFLLEYLPLPNWVYDYYLCVGNWPSLLTGNFPYHRDASGGVVMDLYKGITDIKSGVVNFIGWYVVFFIIGRMRSRAGKDKIE